MSSHSSVVLVQYFVTELGVLAFVVREGFSAPEVVNIELDPKSVRGYCESAFSGESLQNLELLDWQEWRHVLGSLAEPVAKWTSPGETVWIVPDNFLHAMPLHALTVDGVPLIERNPVCYTPSASTMIYCSRKRTGRRVRVASFGDSLLNLPQGREEARVVARAFDTEPLLGPDVTRSNVLRILAAEGGALDVVHFACHIVFDADEPLQSGILLAREPGDDTAGSPRLTAQDILDLRLHADLVLLNGCVSGASVRKPGDELLGLCRAWLYAGAASVLANLWPVDDLSSGILMARFSSELGLGSATPAPGVTKAEALRRAQSYVMNLTYEELEDWERAHIEFLRGAQSAVPAGSDSVTREAIARGERLAYAEAHSRTRAVARPDVPRTDDLAGLRRHLQVDDAEAAAPLTSSPSSRPFSNPYYWAPFVLIGDHR